MNSLRFPNSNSGLLIGNSGWAGLALGCALLLVQGALTQTPCENGVAGQYPCEGLDLMSVRSFEELGGVAPGNGNDCWGWTAEGREFVLFGRSDGTSIVDITDPVNPVMIANVPTASFPSLWRDIKVIGDAAFIVSEAGQHGMQVLDLSQVPAMTPMTTMGTWSLYTGFGSAHNVVANPETGFVYGVGTDTFNGGLHIVNVADPANPTLAGSWEEHYVHDAQVVVYTGPDTDYQGREMAFVFGGFSGFHVVDVEDKEDCQTISSVSGADFVYTHQGWLTEDHRFVLMNDEMDETANIAAQTRTWVVDVQDLDNPVLVGYHAGTLSVTDHNLYTHNGRVYEANYYAGLQVLSMGDAGNLEFEQAAHFSTNPFSDQTGTSGGAWSVYPYFSSGNIAISTQSHLFVVRPSTLPSATGQVATPGALSLRVAEGRVHIGPDPHLQGSLMVFDAGGRLRAEWPVRPGVPSVWMVSDWGPGVYLLKSGDGRMQRFVLP